MGDWRSWIRGMVWSSEAVFATPASPSSLQREPNRRADRNNGRVEEGGTMGGVSVGLGPALLSVEFDEARGGPRSPLVVPNVEQRYRIYRRLRPGRESERGRGRDGPGRGGE